MLRLKQEARAFAASGLMRRYFHVIALVLILFNSFAGLLSSSLLNAATSCPDFEFVGARGSGESAQPNTAFAAYSQQNNYGMGTTVFNVYDQLSSLIGPSRISAYGVHYPAVSLTGSISSYLNAAGAFLHIKPLGSYTDSVRAGTSDVQSYIESFHANCTSTRFILSGYSQGAQAVGDALQKMPAADQQLVAAATFFGDPNFNASSWSSKASDNTHFGLLGVRNEWPESLHGKVLSYCNPHDPICGLSKKLHILGDGDVYSRVRKLRPLGRR